MLPPHETPLRNALTSIKEVLDAFERGQWTPEGDAVLSTAIEQVEASEPGRRDGVDPARHRHDDPDAALPAGAEGRRPAGLAVAGRAGPADRRPGVGQRAGGRPRRCRSAPSRACTIVFIASVVMMRIQVSYRAPGARQDAAWRDDTLRLTRPGRRSPAPGAAGVRRPDAAAARQAGRDVRRAQRRGHARRGTAHAVGVPAAAAPRPIDSPKAPSPPQPTSASKPARPPQTAPPAGSSSDGAPSAPPAAAQPAAAASRCPRPPQPGLPRQATPRHGGPSPGLSQFSPQVLSGLQAWPARWRGRRRS